jgi:hypothetical protein
MTELAYITPRAAEAVIAQLAYESNTTATRYAMVDGAEMEFEVYHSTEWVNRGGHYMNRDEFPECEIVGAWSADEDGYVIFAGNRAELVALIGEAKVCEWEADIAQAVFDGGRW